MFNSLLEKKEVFKANFTGLKSLINTINNWNLKNSKFRWNAILTAKNYSVIIVINWNVLNVSGSFLKSTRKSVNL